jgi:hypothetical protein
VNHKIYGNCQKFFYVITASFTQKNQSSICERKGACVFGMVARASAQMAQTHHSDDWGLDGSAFRFDNFVCRIKSALHRSGVLDLAGGRKTHKNLGGL